MHAPPGTSNATYFFSSVENHRHDVDRGNERRIIHAHRDDNVDPGCIDRDKRVHHSDTAVPSRLWLCINIASTAYQYTHLVLLFFSRYLALSSRHHTFFSPIPPPTQRWPSAITDEALASIGSCPMAIAAVAASVQGPIHTMSVME
jgi:hypothetical protein